LLDATPAQRPAFGRDKGLLLLREEGETANNLFFYIHILSLLPLKPFGPHILPEFLNKPVRIYQPNLDRNLIGVENRNRTIIYQ
jgi:hypothetical protein